MKKMLSVMLIMASGVCLTACSNEEEICVPQEVEFSLDYTFVESGSMTRATGESVYSDFYEKYIKTKQLTPNTYSLTFNSKETNDVVMTIKGSWNESNSIRLPEGDYIVKGKSQPIERETYYGYEYPSDTVYLTFDEEVRIVKDMSNLTLTAKYDAFLLLFDKQNTEKISLQNEKNLSSKDNVFWLFMRDKIYTSSNNSSPKYYMLYIDRNNGDKISIETTDIPFEKGKYYYFNDITNSFDLPKMQSGN